ncbi:MAG: SusC/RagA family TonB-linked outer membrane protein, partial [Bacteroidota bacterium]
MKNNYKDQSLEGLPQMGDSRSPILTGWNAQSWWSRSLSPVLQVTLCLLMFMGAHSVMAQQMTVSGTVKDANGEGVPGVSVYEKGTTNGTITDFNGKYSLKANRGATIIFQSMGYATQELVLGAQSTLDIIMKDDTETLDEVIVVGYGVQQKREVTGSIAKVEGAKILQTQTPSFEAALQGQAAGVQVIQGSGLAGSGSVIRIRGTNSISSGGDPLYVVDGIPITADPFLAENNFSNGAFNNNPLSALNPNDIESVEILKDAAATGIYGSRGANGVILITTKRGSNRNSKPKFNFNVSLGTSDPVNDPNLLSGPEWLAVRQEAWELDGNTGAVWLPGYSQASDPADVRRAAFEEASGVDTDWWDLLTQTGIRQQYDFSVNYGREKFKAYFGVSYADNETFLVGNSFKRLSFRGNFDVKITPKLDAQISASYSRAVNERVRVSYTGGLGDAMSVALPIYPVFNEDGTFFRGNTEVVANPLFTAANFQGFTVDKRTITTARLNYRPVKGLTISAFGGIDYLDQANDQFETGELRGLTPEDGRSERDVRWVTNFNFGATAEYQIPLNQNHNLKVLVGT